MAADYYLKIDGIEGESTDAGHPNEIQVLSWSWGESNPTTAVQGTGLGSGKVNMSDFNFMTTTSKATPKLMLHVANGEHLKKAVLTCRKQGKEQQEYLQYTFEDLVISSYQASASSGGDDVPTESISLAFTKISVGYKAQKADGTLDGAINFKADIKQNTYTS